jgi:hypothetical protein
MNSPRATRMCKTNRNELIKIIIIIITNNSMALVRERTISTERPPLVGEISANILQIEGAMWSA